MRRPRSDQRGFALLIVLWTLALLGMVAIGLAATGRGEVKLSENLRDAALAEAAADGAVYQAIFELAAGSWAPGPLPHVVRIGGTMVRVQIEDAAHLINPNTASPELMAALLRAVGADPRTSRALGDATENFRDIAGADASPYVAARLAYGPSRQNFRSVAELRLVIGMTPALYALLAPHLSIASLPFVMPDATVDPVVAAACHDAAQHGGDACRPPPARIQPLLANLLVARIVAKARAGSAQFTRAAEARFSGRPPNGRLPSPYRIETWEHPGAD